MVPLAVPVARVVRPPAAYVVVGARHVPLAVSSWCWRRRCGAPIAASGRAVVLRRKGTVRVRLGFAAATAQVAVAGLRVRVSRSGSVLSWRATRPGGMTIHVTSRRGWVVYVGRLVLR
ncbi:MAG: hypothetical protein ACRDM1_03870 [Gaiellaceae bacterium]